MKAVDITENSSIIVKEVNEPSIGSGDVLIRLNGCGICGTDKENLDGDKTGAKDGNNNPDQYADSDGEEMKEAIRQTERNLNKRPTKRLKDIGNVTTGIPALGQIARKFNK